MSLPSVGAANSLVPLPGLLEMLMLKNFCCLHHPAQSCSLRNPGPQRDIRDIQATVLLLLYKHASAASPAYTRTFCSRFSKTKLVRNTELHWESSEWYVKQLVRRQAAPLFLESWDGT